MTIAPLLRGIPISLRGSDTDALSFFVKLRMYRRERKVQKHPRPMPSVVVTSHGRNRNIRGRFEAAYLSKIFDEFLIVIFPLIKLSPSLCTTSNIR